MLNATTNQSKSAKRQAALNVVTRVLHIRIKDKHGSLLRKHAHEVNDVWNYSQELSLKVLERERRFMSAFDMAEYTKGAAKEGLSLHSQTVQAVSEEYCTRRKQFKKDKLRWRVSHGVRRSLGWIPVKAVALSYKNGQVHYQGKALSLWDSYGLADYTLRSGSFSEDAQGRWYLNVTVDVKKPKLKPSEGETSVGIDLGLKTFAAMSNGETIDAQRFYRSLEAKLALAQRAHKKERVRAIHAKIANRRKDFLHKCSTKIVSKNHAIFVGNVNASGLAKTNMAKSVLDAGWSTFRTMLMYKSDSAGVRFREVNESYSTQECSSCHARTGPVGRAGLSVRSWTCSSCGVSHDRDVNAAINIKQRGLREWEKEFATTDTAKAVNTVVNKSRLRLGVGHDPLVAGIPVL